MDVAAVIAALDTHFDPDEAAIAAPRTTAAGVRAEEIASSLKVSRATVYRALAEVESIA